MVRTRMAVRRRARSRLAWAALTVAPWCLAGGLVVSMGAEAGQEAALAAARAGLTDRAPAMPGDLAPLDEAVEGRGFAVSASEPIDRPTAVEEVEPRAPLEADRPAPREGTGRGDPSVAVRPTFAARLAGAGALPRSRAAAALGDGDGAAEGAPVETAALPTLSRGAAGVNGGDGPAPGPASARPDYAALVETALSAPEQRCLAQAVYFEARSEPEEGQAAVAQVVLNRATSGLYPGSVCGVVFQNQQRRKACQFSFACEGRGLRVGEGKPWSRAVRIARAVTDGTTYVSDVGGATHYHASSVRPAWARALTPTDTIGRHVFYTLKPGQT